MYFKSFPNFHLGRQRSLLLSWSFKREKSLVFSVWGAVGINEDKYKKQLIPGELPYSLTMPLWFLRGRTLLLFCCLDLHGKPEAENDGLCLVTPSCLTLCGVLDSSPSDSFVHGDSPGKNTGVSCHFLLHGIFPIQRLNPVLPHCRLILYWLSHWRMMWVASICWWPRDFPGSSG